MGLRRAEFPLVKARVLIGMNPVKDFAGRCLKQPGHFSDPLNPSMAP